jgi:hypothetical protein
MQEAFVDSTRVTLEECGKWLQEHAEELSSEISGGCVRWSVTFRAGNNGLFPDVGVRVDGSRTELVNEAEYIWAVRKFCARDERHEYGKPFEKGIE